MDKTEHIGVICRFTMAGEDGSIEAGWVRHASLVRIFINDFCLKVGSTFLSLEQGYEKPVQMSLDGGFLT